MLGKVSVTGGTTLGGTLTTTGAATLNGGLTVSGGTRFNGDTQVNGGATVFPNGYTYYSSDTRAILNGHSNNHPRCSCDVLSSMQDCPTTPGASTDVTGVSSFNSSIDVGAACYDWYTIGLNTLVQRAYTRLSATGFGVYADGSVAARGVLSTGVSAEKIVGNQIRANQIRANQLQIGTQNNFGVVTICDQGACGYFAADPKNLGEDTYGSPIPGAQTDTCDGDLISQYTCAPADNMTCWDSARTLIIYYRPVTCVAVFQMNWHN